MARTRIIITKVTNPAELNRQLEPHMRSFGNALGARMQRIVPKKSYALNDTITTATSIVGNKVRTEVGVGSKKVDYWRHVDRGTSKQKAQPYIMPALLQSKAGDLNYKGPGPETRGVKKERQAQSRSERNAARRARYVGSAKR